MSEENEHGSFRGVRVDVEQITAGQPRPYADSVYEAELRFTNWWPSTSGPRKGNWEPERDTVKELARLLVHPFEDGEPPRFGASYLKSLGKTGPQTWRVVIVSPYMD